MGAYLATATALSRLTLLRYAPTPKVRVRLRVRDRVRARVRGRVNRRLTREREYFTFYSVCRQCTSVCNKIIYTLVIK